MGWGADGQLGQGCDDKDIPSQVPIDCSIKKLSSSTDFTLLLTNKHTLWTWGNSEYGQGMQGKKIDRVKKKWIIRICIRPYHIIDSRAIKSKHGSGDGCGSRRSFLNRLD